MRKKLYLTLAILGLAVPYYFFMGFLAHTGPDPAAFLRELVATNISKFFVADLILSFVVFFSFMAQEARRLGIKNSWVYLLATLLVGLSFSLPVFLYVRESKLEREARTPPTVN